MTKKRKSSFRGRVREDAQKQDQQGSSYGYLNLPKGMKIFKAPPGKKVLLDIIPYEITSEKDSNLKADIGLEVGDLWYRKAFKVHKNVGEERDSVICPRSFGKKCPICEHREKLAKAGDSTKEEIKSLYPSYRSLYAVIPLGSKDYDDEVHVWDMSDYLFQELLKDELKENDEYELFPEIEEGLSLRIRFDSETFGDSKPFAKASRIDFEEREEQYNEKILEEVPNLEELLIVLSYDEIHNMYWELDEDDLANEDIKEETTSSRRRKSVKDEDENEEKSERTSRRGKETKDKEEEETKPTRTRRGKEKENDKNECPEGFTFGSVEDCEKHDECDTCDKWDACVEEKDKNK